MKNERKAKDCGTVSGQCRIRRMLRHSLTVLLLILCAVSACGCSTGRQIDEYREKGIALYKEGDYEGAIAAFDKAMEASYGKVTPTQTDILKYRAECELRTGDYEAARASYDALMQLEDGKDNPGDYDGLFAELEAQEEVQKAVEQMEQGEYETAIGILEPLASLKSGTVSGQAAWFNQAVCYEYMQDYAKAAEMFGAYVEQYPGDEAAQKEYRFCESRR